MIHFTTNKEGDLKLTQQEVSPTIYLDHWALRRFSEDDALSTRFTAALKSRNGTLALSWMNLAEFTKVTIEEQIRKAEVFLEAKLPQVFFLEVDPFLVISKEDELLAGGAPTPPHADLDFLRAFSYLKPTSLNPFTAHDLFQSAQADGLDKKLDDFANTVVDRVESMRDEFDTNPGFQSAIRRSPSGPEIQRGTRYILREMVRTLLVDQGMKITRNHAIDLIHTVVPVAYCDLVLLDKHWETQVNRVRSRFNAADMSVPLGKVFSGRANGIDQFFCALETDDI